MIRKIALWLDKYLEWHKPTDEITMDPFGFQVYSKCKYCGKEIMLDSQGNWF